MANSKQTGGGKWTVPSATVAKPETAAAKSKSSTSVAGTSKRANTMPHDFSVASTLSTKNKHHGG